MELGTGEASHPSASELERLKNLALTIVESGKVVRSTHGSNNTSTKQDVLLLLLHKEYLSSAKGQEHTGSTKGQGMSWIGRTFKKDFGTHGIYKGTIDKYDDAEKLYHVKYEDDDEEDLGEYQMYELLYPEAKRNKETRKLPAFMITEVNSFDATRADLSIEQVQTRLKTISNVSQERKGILLKKQVENYLEEMGAGGGPEWVVSRHKGSDKQFSAVFCDYGLSLSGLKSFSTEEAHQLHHTLLVDKQKSERESLDSVEVREEDLEEKKEHWAKAEIELDKCSVMIAGVEILGASFYFDQACIHFDIAKKLDQKSDDSDGMTARYEHEILPILSRLGLKLEKLKGGYGNRLCDCMELDTHSELVKQVGMNAQKKDAIGSLQSIATTFEKSASVEDERGSLVDRLVHDFETSQSLENGTPTKYVAFHVGLPIALRKFQVHLPECIAAKFQNALCEFIRAEHFLDGKNSATLITKELLQEFQDMMKILGDNELDIEYQKHAADVGAQDSKCAAATNEVARSDESEPKSIDMDLKDENSADRRKEDWEGTLIIEHKCEICKNVLELTTSGDLAFLFKEKQGHDTDETDLSMSPASSFCDSTGSPHDNSSSSSPSSIQLGTPTSNLRESIHTTNSQSHHFKSVLVCKGCLEKAKQDEGELIYSQGIWATGGAGCIVVLHNTQHVPAQYEDSASEVIVKPSGVVMKICAAQDGSCLDDELEALMALGCYSNLNGSVEISRRHLKLFADLSSVKILQDTESSSLQFFFQKRLHEISLTKFLKTKNPSLLQRLQISISILENLLKLWEAGIVHFDVKTDNILIGTKD
eukprot:CAMPEP_0173100692 /NCGR_PEP_ID=MMETSP1102-20130122/36365_1 /TAXON_ID=49646 /ORGANISM="Geminigera sp., Strain Caron Lab Isolate" /LENGTH=819 /DNA_ID=CAMNT_0013994203 /DNA_START=221 /DNA_END=2680 /DNA_ORIENTATION=-